MKYNETRAEQIESERPRGADNKTKLWFCFVHLVCVQNHRSPARLRLLAVQSVGFKPTGRTVAGNMITIGQTRAESRADEKRDEKRGEHDESAMRRRSLALAGDDGPHVADD